LEKNSPRNEKKLSVFNFKKSYKKSVLNKNILLIELNSGP